MDEERIYNPAIGDVLPGIYRGIVTNNLDEDGLLRLNVKVPSITGDGEFKDVWPCVLPPVVSVVLPKPGDPVWIMFEAGDIAHPVWMGTWLTATARQEFISLSAEIDAINARLSAIEDELAKVDLVGEIKMTGYSTVPGGYLLCDGSAVSRTTYALLFAAIGTTWGVGDGSTTFNVPDIKGRTPVGAGSGSGLTTRTLGTKFGEETHALNVAETVAHHHTLDEEISVTEDSNWGLVNDSDYAGSIGFKDRVMVHSLVHTTDTHDTGSGSGHNTVQPSTAVRFMIRTGL